MSNFYPKLKEDFQKLLVSVRGKKIAVAGHMRPDGDCISSQFAMAEVLKNAGAAEVVCVNQNAIPYLYVNFCEGKNLLSAEDFNDTSFEVVSVDCADYSRINKKFCELFPKPLACIDHHATNFSYANINIIDPDASATAELIAALMYDCDMKISKALASLLYMGIVMDTRQFTTSSTRPTVFGVATRLVEDGADAAYVAEQLYQREKFGKQKLLAEFLQDMQLYMAGRICIGTLQRDVYEKTGSEKADSDGLVDYARSVNGVEIAILLEELDNGVKGSLRSKGESYRVDKIAMMFGGGGHRAAAGFTAEGENLKSFYPKIISIIENHLNNLDEK